MNQGLKSLIRTNKAFCAIVIFFILFSAFHFIFKPSITYNEDGEFRQFGLEYIEDTFLPIWLVSMVLGVLSYLAVLYICSIRTIIPRQKPYHR